MKKILLLLFITTTVFAQEHKKTILVTGGAGYIGSHTALLLAQENYQVIILDLLLHNQKFDHPWATLIYGDCGDKDILNHLFATYNIHAVMHFAGNIEVGESVKSPLKFYSNNISNTISLLDVMRVHGCHLFIFSSSCAVYGIPQWLPLTEDHPTKPISPYGHTKLMIEHILQDCESAYGIRSVALRYFNAAGALPESGLYEQHEPETHLIPLLLRAAYTDKQFHIFGTDHATPDGTCIRDFLHVWDIAHAHLQALHYLEQGNPSDIFNLGTGKGTSVQEMISEVKKICKKDIRIIQADKRAGDPAILVANANKAHNILGWQPQHSDISSILQSAYKSTCSFR
ncbi:MAG TPA: UDP-glucose 4-epimerase GalE [Candidatus Dependentiae bacterium]|nr:UDP-glucose 4-epimerase GalE [Candidatus Dependentiae bacterium]HRQ63115.1 UDP-glucose 4-epimerase GalE [Candidatus Dependentiae bacterium]